MASASGWLRVACVAAVLEVLNHETTQAGRRAKWARKKLTGTPAWTVVTAV